MIDEEAQTEADEILHNADEAYARREITLEQWTDIRRLTIKSMLTIDERQTS